jgi:hypothetical protein
MMGDIDEQTDGPSSHGPTFELVVGDVFPLRERGGIAVVGPAPASGVVHSGDAVAVVRDGQVIGAATAYVELHARAGDVALFIPDPAPDVRIGDHVRTGLRCAIGREG